MNEYETKTKVGHPVLGIFLALLGMFTALLLTFFVGAGATAVAVVLGVIAVLLGVGARKGGRGIGAIIMGGVAVAMAVIMLFNVVGSLNKLHDKAESTGKAPLISKYMENPYFGLMGIFANLPKDEGTLNELMQEIDALNATVIDTVDPSGTNP